MKVLLIIVLMLIPFASNAQDVIVKKDGSTIISKVLEVNPTDIKYKKQSNLNGPTYTINKSEVMSINYANGDSDKFNQSSNTNSKEQNSENNCVKKAGDSRNTELLSLYNKVYYPNNILKPSKSLAKKYILVFGIKDSSVLSNEDLEISINKAESWLSINSGFYSYDDWVINIKNKTNDVIYIDKSHCFKTFQDGNNCSFYDDSKQYVESDGSNSGVSVGLGGIASAIGVGGPVGAIASGISVGGGNSSSVSTIYNDQQIIQIPYGGCKNFTENKWIGEKNIIENEILDFYIMDKFNNHINGMCHFNSNLPQQLTQVGGVKIYDENESPYVIRYTIVYSTTPDFKKYSSLEFELYLHEVIGYNGKHQNNIFSGKAHFSAEEYLDGYNEYTIYGFYDGK